MEVHLLQWASKIIAMKNGGSFHGCTVDLLHLLPSLPGVIPPGFDPSWYPASTHKV